MESPTSALRITLNTTYGTYLQTETRKISNWRYVPSTWTVPPADSSGDIDFLFERQSLNL